MTTTMSDAFPAARLVSPGSKLAIVAPSGPFDHERFQAGLKILRERYEITFRDDLFESEGYFAGSDERRLTELRDAIRDPSIEAILCARGGYGATRILPGLEVDAVAKANKLLVGFSDVTALHALWSRAGVRSIHGPMVASLARATEPVIESWFQVLEGSTEARSWDLDVLVEGSTEGRLIGGNLAVLASLVGTPFAPPLDDCLLFLEDVGERPYRIDRVLTSLEQAGWLSRCAGFIIGAFTEGDPGPDGVATEQVIQRRLAPLGIPVVSGFPAGHVDDNWPLPLGIEARIDGGKFTIFP